MRSPRSRFRDWRNRRLCARDGHAAAHVVTYFHGRDAIATATCPRCNELLGAGVDTLSGPLRRELGRSEHVEPAAQPTPPDNASLTAQPRMLTTFRIGTVVIVCLIVAAAARLLLG